MLDTVFGKCVAVGIGLAFAPSACSGGGADETGTAISELRVVTSETGSGEYAFELPPRVPAGATRLAVVNEGRELHHTQLFKLDEGATVADLAGALATGDPAAALAFGTFEGGTALVAPGASSKADAVVGLTEGTYVLVCFVEGSDGQPHLAHGMLEPFEVTPPNDPPEVPEADVDVDLVDYGFRLPDSIPGDALLQVTNRGTVEPHEIAVARLDDGATAEDVLDALASESAPPATAVGGIQALLPGASQALQLDLEPGRYVVLCEIPSPFDQTPHHEKGMVEEVTIT